MQISVTVDFDRYLMSRIIGRGGEGTRAVLRALGNSGFGRGYIKCEILDGSGESESEHSHENDAEEHTHDEETDKDEEDDDDAPEATIGNIDQVVASKGELTFLTSTDRKITVSGNKSGKVSVRVNDEKKSKSMTVDDAKKILADGEKIEKFVEETDE